MFRTAHSRRDGANRDPRSAHVVETGVADHVIEPEPDFVHFDFSREREPVLWAESGDTVVVRTLDAAGFLEPYVGPKRPPRMGPDDAGHALCGPIGIRGAMPGQTLEIELRDIRPESWGFTVAGGPEPLTRGLAGNDVQVLHWTIDADNATAVDQHGHYVRLHPFMGVMGMPPHEPGPHPTSPPRFCGGNIDCKELVAGTRLFLPVSVPDVRFSIGDGHALQGDGEVSGTAIECPMERVEFVMRLHDWPLSMPRAQTPEAWITLGVHEDLDEAVVIATAQMLDLMEQYFGIDRHTALALASLVVDVRVTQVVNGVVGAHAVLRNDALT
jgi:acetamidase/formamidase